MLAAAKLDDGDQVFVTKYRRAQQNWPRDLDPVIGQQRNQLDHCVALGVEAFACTHWADGGTGIEPLARSAAALADGGTARFQPLYDDDLPLWQKARTAARSIYGAYDIIAYKRVRARFADLQRSGYGHFPVCMAKTQYSFSTDPDLKGAPSNHVVPIREIRLWTGAEFLVIVWGEIMTMPGLQRAPSGAPGRCDLLRGELTAQLRQPLARPYMAGVGRERIPRTREDRIARDAAAGGEAFGNVDLGDYVPLLGRTAVPVGRFRRVTDDAETLRIETRQCRLRIHMPARCQRVPCGERKDIVASVIGGQAVGKRIIGRRRRSSRQHDEP